MEDIARNGNEGIEKTEPLTGNLTGFWARRINDKERMIYKLNEENVYILLAYIIMGINNKAHRFFGVLCCLQGIDYKQNVI